MTPNARNPTYATIVDTFPQCLKARCSWIEQCLKHLLLSHYWTPDFVLASSQVGWLAASCILEYGTIIFVTRAVSGDSSSLHPCFRPLTADWNFFHLISIKITEEHCVVNHIIYLQLSGGIRPILYCPTSQVRTAIGVVVLYGHYFYDPTESNAKISLPPIA